MSKELEIPIKDTKRKGLIFYSGSIQKIHDKGNKRTDKRNCIISDFDIRYYKKNKPDRQFFWSNIVSAKYLENEGEFDFIFNPSKTFDEKTNELCRFLPQDADELASLLGKFLYRFLGKNEINERIELQTFIQDKFDNIPRACMSRFKSSLGIKYGSTEEFREITTFLNDHLRPRSNNIMLKQDLQKVMKFMPNILYSLITYPYADQITIPNSEGNDVSRALTGLRNHTFPFKHIAYGENPTVNFSSFWESLSTFSFDNLVSLALLYFPMNEEYLESISKGGSEKKLTSLGFIGADYLDANFYSKLFTPSFDSLVYLNICQARNLDLKLLFANTKQIKHLNIGWINVEIADILQALHESGNSNYVSINLNGNPATKQLGDIKLPDSLVRLDAGFSQYSNKVLTQLFDLVNRSKVTSLYLPNSHVSPEDMVDLTNYLFKQSMKLQRLSWSGNDIDSNFFVFLSKCKGLKCLYMDRCFNQAKAFLIPEFVIALKSLTKLEKIFLRGIIDQSCGPVMNQVVQVLKEISNLETIEISDQEIGNDAFTALIDIVRSSRVKELGFDNSNIDNPELINQIAEAAESRNESVLLAFPFDTIDDLIENHEAPEELYDDSMIRFNRIHNPQAPAKDEQDPMTNPFDYTVIYTCDVYPEYRNDYIVQETENGHPEELSLDTEEEKQETEFSSQKKSKKQQETDSESSEELPPPKKSKKQQETDSKSSEELPPPKKSKKQQETDSESSESPSPPPRKQQESELSDHLLPSPEKSKERIESSESPLLTPKKSNKQPEYDSIEEEIPSKRNSESDQSEEEEKLIPKKQRKPDVIKPEPKKNKYEEPKWKTPEQIRKQYDNKKSEKKLQKQFDLNTLLNKITNDK
ncbi:hypothetical protein TVAG_436310 [Trichomonas vaginalis G3]|uniref:Leucine Rich Repeat family protein n=1 Tax=Trichomonas vaginalis (strain ATCC PRA-98 / G3) TaxID=412133 RepID=A2G5J6_TRIV3|nr:leucine-rich repeat, isoform f-related family [Trichomonas vaginalis G3]EAX87568.1 hypothetical protein TVAG_436310 [Trichomonas vaginalis G3]KAI5494610.1 leucine-rich repeat, isoform f-related family [Trichomonas vaginalis G3]|eukprot:XP_001300498.1 hypothetical protein [Trichomonas vaginalis G3]